VINAPCGPWSSSTGSLRTFAAGIPELTSDGPSPRSTTGLDTLPRIMNPPIMTLSPVSTRRRGEMFNAWAGVDVGVAVGVGVGVAVAVAVAVGVAVAVAVGVAVGVGAGALSGWRPGSAPVLASELPAPLYLTA